MKLLSIIALIHSFGAQSCAEILKRIPCELMPKLFKIDNQYISISSILKLRLVCKVFDEKIIATINNNMYLLEQFQNSFILKNPNTFLKKEISFLNRLPNLHTHFSFKISILNYYLFSQNFSFCKTDKEYKALYKKQEQIVLEGLLLFDKEFQTGFFTIDLASKYGWLNHGIAQKTSRECNFSQIGFLFFDDHFSPPSTFWNMPYDKDTINPINVLISLSFNYFFEKALKNFVIKIP